MEKVLLGTIDASAEWKEAMMHDARQCIKDEILWESRAVMMNYGKEYIASIKQLAKEIKEESENKTLIEVDPNNNYKEINNRKD